MTMASWSRWFAAACVASTILVGAPPQDATTEEAANTGRITLNMGVDWVSEYFFRGIA